MPLTIKSLKGRLWFDYYSSWSQIKDYRFVAEQVIAEIMQNALKDYTQPTIERLLDVLTSKDPEAPLSDTEIDVCYRLFSGKPLSVEAMHKLFDKRVQDFEAYEAGVLDARDMKPHIHEQQAQAWEDTFTLERKQQWLAKKGVENGAKST
jgi:hypothetical protein